MIVPSWWKAALGIAALPFATGAQQIIPVRPLGPIIATSAWTFAISRPRELPDGRVLVVNLAARQLMLLDASLQHTTFLGAATDAPGGYNGPSFLISAPGDSSYLGDLGNQRILAIDAAGQIATRSVLEEPQGRPAPSLVSLVNLGTPAVDLDGRIIFEERQVHHTTPTEQIIDSIMPILRLDPRTMRIDTLGSIRTMGQHLLTAGAPDSLVTTTTNEPFHPDDNWVVMSDGSLAMIRAADFHVDWVAPDGQRSSSPPVPYDRRRVTEADRADYLTELKALDSTMRVMFAKVSPMLASVFPRVVTTPPDHWPDFLPPFELRSAIAAPDDTFWIKMLDANPDEVIYDVVDRQGRKVDAVRVPKGRAIVGFGKGVAYLIHEDTDGLWHLERARLR